MGRQCVHALVVGIILASAVVSAARSQNLFEQLVTPGPLVSGHAKLEKDCSNCHEPFSRRSQTRLCLACHKDIAADRQSVERREGQLSEKHRIRVEMHVAGVARDQDHTHRKQRRKHETDRRILRHES